jgi:hypothetical protein
MDTDKLIRLMHLQTGLWDREHLSHRCIHERNALSEEVAQELKSTSDESKKQMAVIST